MKYILTLFFIIFSCTVSFCQSYQGNPKDTTILKQLIDSVNAATTATYTDCKGTIYKAKALVHKSDNIFFADILEQEGHIYFEGGNFDKAAILWDSAGKIYNRIDQNYAHLDCLSKSGFAYINATNYPAASERLFKGIAIAEKYDEKFMLSNLFTNTGLLYESLEDWDNALVFAKKAIPLKWKSKDTLGVAMCYNNIGNLFSYSNHFDSAITNLKIANKLYNKESNTYFFENLVSIGACFLNYNKPDSAIVYLKKAEALTPTVYTVVTTANLYANLSLAHLAKKDIALSGKYIARSYSIGKDVGDYAILENIYKGSYDYYKAINNTPKALEFLEKLSAVKDTLHAQSKNIEHQKTAIKYELGKKLVADSLQAEQKVFIANGKTIQTRNSLLIVALLLVIALATAIILYSRSKLFKKKAIITEQEKQIEAQQKTAYQLKTLQAQMNPHFVFNCFNTIDSFILQNKQYEASLLVQRFSKLSRKILEQTSLNTISFEEELETLTTYLQIEKLRTNNSFDFTIEKDDAILSYQLPPMLLQPFVENAVVHGIRALQSKDGFIKITVSDKNNFVEINIEDNGVGRNKSAEIKEQNTSPHRSMSMDLTLQRLKALHQNSDIENYLQFTDFENDKTGTLVTIKIPKSVNG